MSGIIRVYKRDDAGVLTFREAWLEAESETEGDVFLVVNHGTVGHQSNTNETTAESMAAGEELLKAFEVQCAEDGYEVIDLADQFWVTASWPLKTKDGTERDHYLEHKAKDALTTYFAWRGIGTVEKTELGAGALVITTLCPDAGKAVAGIKVAIREANLDFTKLTVTVAPYGQPEATKVRHSPR